MPDLLLTPACADRTCADGYVPIGISSPVYDAPHYSCYPPHCSPDDVCDDSKLVGLTECESGYTPVSKGMGEDGTAYAEMCPDWAQAGDCENNAEFMLQQCRRSCADLGHGAFTCCPEAVPPSPPRPPPCVDFPAPFASLASLGFPAECGDVISSGTMMMLQAMVPVPALNGEEACQGHGYDEQQCLSVGCCHWNPYGDAADGPTGDGLPCWSSVGQNECVTQGAPTVVINGQPCDNWIVVGNCEPGYPHYDPEGMVCANDGQSDEAYCSYSVGGPEQACAFCATPRMQAPQSLEDMCEAPMEAVVAFWASLPDGVVWHPPAGVGMEETIAAICPAACGSIDVYADPTCAPPTPYTVNVGTGNTCEVGVEITDAAECQAAAASLGIAHLSNAAYRSDVGALGKVHADWAPGGCLVNEQWQEDGAQTAHNFYFNMHPGAGSDWPNTRKVCKGGGPPTPPTPPAPSCVDADSWGSLRGAIRVNDNGTYTPVPERTYNCTEVLDFALPILGANASRVAKCEFWLSTLTLGGLRTEWAQGALGPRAEYTPPAGYPDDMHAVDLCAATCGDLGIGRCAPPSPPTSPLPSWSPVSNGQGLRLGSSNLPEDKATFTLAQPASAIKLEHTSGAISCHNVPSPCCGCEASNWGASDDAMFIWITDASTGEAVAPKRAKAAGAGYGFGEGSSDFANTREATSLIFHVNLPAGTYHVHYRELNTGPQHLEDNAGATTLDVYTMHQPPEGSYTTMDFDGHCSGRGAPLYQLTGDLTKDECWEKCSGLTTTSRGSATVYNYAQFTPGVYGGIERGACECLESCDGIIPEGASLVLGPCDMRVPPLMSPWVVAWHVYDHAEGETFWTEDEARAKFDELNWGPNALRLYKNSSQLNATREYHGAYSAPFTNWTMLDDWAAAQHGEAPATWPYWLQSCASPPAPPRHPLLPGTFEQIVPRLEVTVVLTADMTVEAYNSDPEAVKGPLRDKLGCHEPDCELQVTVAPGSVILTVVARDTSPNSQLEAAARTMVETDVATLSADLGISLEEPPKLQQVRTVLVAVVRPVPSPPPPALPSPSSPSSPSPATDSIDGTSNVEAEADGGTIAGVVLGCTAGVVALGVAVWCCIKKKKQQAPTLETGAVVSTTAASSAGVQMAGSKVDKDYV